MFYQCVNLYATGNLNFYHLTLSLSSGFVLFRAFFALICQYLWRLKEHFLEMVFLGAIIDLWN
jgi:hypothetical protein